MEKLWRGHGSRPSASLIRLWPGPSGRRLLARLHHLQIPAHTLTQPRARLPAEYSSKHPSLQRSLTRINLQGNFQAPRYLPALLELKIFAVRLEHVSSPALMSY